MSYRLITKEQRQNARSAWIGENKTEIYKDLEILTNTKSEKFYLTIWRGTAGNPCINSYYRDEASRQKQIDYSKRQSDTRETHRNENKVKGKVLTQSAKCALNIRNILKGEYPNVKFSVISDNFANGNSVDISWVDGMPTKEIDTFVRQFEYGTFDGMTDCYNVDNRLEMPQAKFVHCQRTISKEKQDVIRQQLADLMKIENTDYAIIPKDYMVNVRGYAFDAPLNALVYQISVDFDFRKGFHGVRCQISKEFNTPIGNMFELY